MGLFVADYIKVDGKILGVVDNTIKLEGIDGKEYEAVLGSDGNDDTKRKRVERKISCEVKLGQGVTTTSLWICDKQIIVGQTPDCGSGSDRRLRAYPCTTMSVGEIAEGTAEVTYIVKSPVEWM